MIVQATVTYPITVNVDVTDQEVETIKAGELEVIDVVRERIKRQADDIFETSTLDPVITWCDMEGLTE